MNPAVLAARNALERPDGFTTWFETFAKIQLPAPILDEKTGRLTKLATPVANYLQQQFCTLIEHCQANNLPCRAIMLKPRQIGCSTISVGNLYKQTRHHGLEGMIIGGQYDQTDELWKILKRYHDNDSFPWAAGGVVNERAAKYENGGMISKRTAQNENAGRAGTYQAVIVTELGRWEEGGKASAGDVLQGVQATVAQQANTFIVLESTARGNTGVFYEQWQNSVTLEQFLAGDYEGIPYVQIFAPAHAFAKHRLPLTPRQEDELRETLTEDERWRMAEFDAPMSYIAWRRDTLRNMCRGNETRLKFDFPDTPEEAFHASSMATFSTQAINLMRAEARKFPGTHGVLRAADDEPWSQKRFVFEPREVEHSEVMVWEQPMPGLAYLMSVDTMTGEAKDKDGRKRDHHCATVLRNGYLDPRTGRWMPPKVVARSRPPTRNPEWNCQWNILAKLGPVVWALHRFYGSCMVAPESNKDGGLILLLFQKGVPIFERNKQQDSGGERPDIEFTGKLGFLTVGGHAENTRSWILTQLEDAVARYGQEGHGIEILDTRTLDEMTTFIENPKGRKEAAPGEHDDSVMALAIAYALRDHATTYLAPRNPGSWDGDRGKRSMYS